MDIVPHRFLERTPEFRPCRCGRARHSGLMAVVTTNNPVVSNLGNTRAHLACVSSGHYFSFTATHQPMAVKPAVIEIKVST